MKILTIDIGGTHVKILATGQTDPRRIDSDKDMTPAQMVSKVQELVQDWEYEAVSIGFPGLAGASGPLQEPENLGSGWVGFDFAAAFGRPVKFINDAAMQALGSYQGGRMLFVGLGTSLGSTLISGKVVIPLELGQLPYDDQRSLVQVLGSRGRKRLGGKRWERAVHKIVPILKNAFAVDYVVIGGGKADKLEHLPSGALRGDNRLAFVGGFRLWDVDVVPTGSPSGEIQDKPAREAWTVV